MKKTHLLLPALITGMLLVPAIPGFAFGGHGGRHANYERRIERRARNRAITRGEYRRLERGRRHLRYARRRAWSDGYLTWRERERVVRVNRRFNRRIYWARHSRWIAAPWRSVCIAAPVVFPPPVRVRYWSPEPRFYISGFIGDPSFALGWSFNLP